MPRGVVEVGSVGSRIPFSLAQGKRGQILEEVQVRTC